MCLFLFKLAGAYIWPEHAAVGLHDDVNIVGGHDVLRNWPEQ